MVYVCEAPVFYGSFACVVGFSEVKDLKLLSFKDCPARYLL